MKAAKKENKVNTPITKDNVVEEVKTVKKVAPHWTELGEFPKYLTVVQPFYNQRLKMFEVRVIQADGLEVEKNSFDSREEAEKNYFDLLSEVKNGLIKHP